ncbi:MULTISPECIES: hypothetical protein [unclassified Streptomyces]|uniref:hypothetical protein n=1 Tax=unclassified Streptomyces TaxID=2593676 RepID=UPI002E199A6D|nr:MULTISPECIES: hypothetical protein [unclassified Streptomyces]
MGIGLLFGAQSCIKAISSTFDNPGGSETSPASTAASCPDRIANELPSGDGAELVEAFRTDNKQITLCRTEAGKLYYFGEWSDHREAGISMPAKRTDDGYEASNPPYRYDIHDDTVTIYKSGTRIGQEEVTPEPSPE